MYYALKIVLTKDREDNFTLQRYVYIKFALVFKLFVSCLS